MGIWRFIVRRAVFSVVTVLSTAILTFVVLRMAPGDPAVLISGEGASPEFLAIVRKEYGLDLPLPQQLWLYLSTLARGNFGYSISFSRPVFNVIMERLPQTILLVGTSLSLAIVIGVLLGMLAARRPFSIFDRVINTFTLGLYSIPVFWLGLVLIYDFSLAIPLFPSRGIFDIGVENNLALLLPNLLWHLALPTITLAALFVATYARLLRAGLLKELSENYVLFARSKGVSEAKIMSHHTLRNAMLPVITVAGIQFGLMVGGVVLTERVFSWPGVGSLLVSAVASRDYPLITGVFIVTAVSVAISNLIADIIYGIIDPRVRAGML